MIFLQNSYDEAKEENFRRGLREKTQPNTKGAKYENQGNHYLGQENSEKNEEDGRED